MKTPLATIHTVLEQVNKGALEVNPQIKEKFTRIAIVEAINLQEIALISKEGVGSEFIIIIPLSHE